MAFPTTASTSSIPVTRSSISRSPNAVTGRSLAHAEAGRAPDPRCAEHRADRLRRHSSRNGSSTSISIISPAGTLARMLDATGFEVIDGPDPDGSRESSACRAQERPSAAAPDPRTAREVESCAGPDRTLCRQSRTQSGGADQGRRRDRRLAPQARGLWGAGRLFDALVHVRAASIPNRSTLLIDTHLKAACRRAPRLHAVRPRGPCGSPIPESIVVMSRAFAGEIAAEVAQAARRTPKSSSTPIFSAARARARPRRKVRSWPCNSAIHCVRHAASHDPDLKIPLAIAARAIRNACRSPRSITPVRVIPAAPCPAPIFWPRSTARR